MIILTSINKILPTCRSVTTSREPKKIFARQGLAGDWLDSADILRHRDHRYRELLDQFARSNRMKYQKVIEAIMRNVQHFDPDSKLTHTLATWVRKDSPLSKTMPGSVNV